MDRAIALGSALAAALAMSCGMAAAQPQLPPEALEALKAAKGGGGGGDEKPDFPPFDEVTKDYEKVVSTVSGEGSLYTIYVRERDGQMLAELPRNFESQRLFFGMTIAGGTPTAGIQYSDMYAHWKRFDKRLALIEPNLSTRSTGDAESKRSRDQLFTDRVVLDVPIVTMGPGGGPVIDLDELLVGNADQFFGPMVRRAQTKLATVSKSKAFPQNVELAFELPLSSGQMTTLHYSISALPENTGYKPREADQRYGFFTTVYRDLGDPASDTPWKRYINRWHLEKADPSLKMSPPKEPIVFYIEHTTPIRYRRWVRDGILEWNKAFEQVGIVNAIEVYQQDARTGAHMDKDPEDVRYNFHRWNANGLSFAIGPSRADPRTGQILDADVVMNDGWIRAYVGQWQRLIPDIATEGFSPETMAWLDERPQWDPRLRLADPLERKRLLNERMRRNATGQSVSSHAAMNADPTLMGDDEFDGLAGRVSQISGLCMHTSFKGMDLAMARMARDMVDVMSDDEDGNVSELDGVPEDFIGPLIKDVVTHEIGHTIGLRHNFKASTVYSLEEINSRDMIGKAHAGSVMDYNPVNINFGDGEVQGDWSMVTVGPYDMWAILCGYGDEKQLEEALDRVAEPELIFATDENTFGPDPRARRYDFGGDPLDFCDSRMRLVHDLRSKILERSVEDGESWEKARQAYQVLLGQHVNAVSVAANWVGGSYLNRDRKGDPGDRMPIQDISADTQRRALEFVVENAFNDEAFGLTPELLSAMTIDKNWDAGGFSSIFQDETYDVHDRIMGIQASAMTMVMNPTSLRRVYDNEFRIPNDQDALTLPEIFETVNGAVWTELDSRPNGTHTNREPMISSLRRNLQREHIERMVDLASPDSIPGAAQKPVANLATQTLRELSDKIDQSLKAGDRLDAYTRAHLSEAKLRIDQALDATYIYNANEMGGGTVIMMPFGETDGQ